jgi:hypothetical protein
MKIFAIFFATTALISAIASSASANSDEPPSGFAAISQSPYNSSRNNIPSSSDYPCNARSCFFVNGNATQNSNSGTTAGVTIGYVSTSGSSDVIRAETERELAALNRLTTDLQNTNLLLKELSNAIASNNTELINGYAILLAPRLGFKSPQELLEKMRIRR